jgi:hypothetical protein
MDAKVGLAEGTVNATAVEQAARPAFALEAQRAA